MPGKFILRFGFVHYWGLALARVTTRAYMVGAAIGRWSIRLRMARLCLRHTARQRRSMERLYIGGRGYWPLANTPAHGAPMPAAYGAPDAAICDTRRFIEYCDRPKF